MSSVKIYDTTKAVSQKVDQQASTFLRLAVEDVWRLARPITPFKLGNLSKDVVRRVAGLHASIEWNKAYAAYQERGRRRDGTRVVRRYTTAGTGAHYAEKAIDQVVKRTQEYVLKATRL